ncbi:MAG: hypothetical protein ABF276_01570 [Sulfurovum sp.]
MRPHLIIATLLALGFSGCTSSMNVFSEPTQTTQTVATQESYEAPSSQKNEAYGNTMRKIASGIKDDPNYQRIALDTPEKKAWFKSLTYRLWDRQITRQQFIKEGLRKYPDHGYEFNFIVKGFTFN